MGKRAQALLSRQNEDSESKALETVEDYLEEASLQEESGDRWLGSDLSKALRFYQRAYQHYKTSINLQPSLDNYDSYYNACRLLFHVYNIYFKNDGINIYKLHNVAEVLTGDSNSVVQDLSSILQSHEKVCELLENSNRRVPQDLLYNTCLIYTEVIEVEQINSDKNDFNEILNLGLRTQALFKTLINDQINDFKKFLNDLDQINDSSNQVTTPQLQVNENENHFQEEYTSEDVLQPNDIFETLLSAYRLNQAILENISEPSQLLSALDFINPFALYLDEITNELINSFSENNNAKSDMISSIKEDQLQELAIVQTYIKGLSTNNLYELIEIWSNPQLPSIPENFMLCADNIQTLLDRNDLTLSNLNLSDNKGLKEIFWKSLTEMNNKYKFAQELLNKQIAEKKQNLSKADESLGVLIGQLSDLVIARCDIDLQRSQLTNYEPAMKNSSVLFKNAKVFCKSAMNIANTSGGLRERALEKSLREQKKLDAVFRMCLLENKISLGELDQIMTRENWVDQVPNILKLGYYDNFGINQIFETLKNVY